MSLELHRHTCYTTSWDISGYSAMSLGDILGYRSGSYIPGNIGDRVSVSRDCSGSIGHLETLDGNPRH